MDRQILQFRNPYEIFCSQYPSPVTVNGICELQSYGVQQYPTSDGQRLPFPRYTASFDANPRLIFRARDWRMRLFNYPDTTIYTPPYLHWDPTAPVKALYLGVEGNCVIPRLIDDVPQPRCRLMSTATASRWKDNSGIVVDYQTTAGCNNPLIARNLAHEKSINFPEVCRPTSRILIYDLRLPISHGFYQELRPASEYFPSVGLIDTGRCYINTSPTIEYSQLRNRCPTINISPSQICV